MKNTGLKYQKKIKFMSKSGLRTITQLKLLLRVLVFCFLVNAFMLSYVNCVLINGQE